MIPQLLLPARCQQRACLGKQDQANGREKSADHRQHGDTKRHKSRLLQTAAWFLLVVYALLLSLPGLGLPTVVRDVVVGNLVFVSDLLKNCDARAVRLALMHHHYRSGFEWYDAEIEEGSALLHRLLAAANRPDGPDPRPFADRVRAAIDDDLDTPGALDALDDLASAILSGGDDAIAPVVLRELAMLVGVDLSRPIGDPA